MRINRRAFFGSLALAAGVAGATNIAGRKGVQWVAAQRSTAGIAAARAAAKRAAAAASINASQLAQALTLPLDTARIVAVHPVKCGALPIVLEHDSEKFQIDVFRADRGGTPGIVETGELSLFIHNRADGTADTGRTRELGARALGAALRGHEAEPLLVSALLTFRERSEQFPGAVFDVDHGIHGILPVT